MPAYHGYIYGEKRKNKQICSSVPTKKKKAELTWNKLHIFFFIYF